MSFAVKDMVVLSVTDPAEAARRLMALELSREALWTALALAAVLNTLLFTLSEVLNPSPQPAAGMMDSPVMFFLIVAGGLVGTIYSIFWVGGMMGGKGSLQDVMTLMVWMQFLRVLVQGAAIFLMMVIPILSALLVFAATVIGIYIFLHFVDQAHRFQSLGKAAVALIGSVLALALALAILLSLVGGPMLGDIPNV